MLNIETYSYKTNPSFFDYEFESIGPKGMIKKVGRFTLLGTNIYNFGFGDLNEETGEINDSVASGNGDGDKVLATVAQIVFDFAGVYPEALVFIQGTTVSRTRRYQMGISRHWKEINPVFDIWGLQNEKWHSFEPGKNYEAFLGRRKSAFFL